MGFSRQEYWSGSPFPSPGDLQDPGIVLLFNWAALILVVVHRISDLPCIVRNLHSSTWNLVPQPGIQAGPPALGAQSLNHWTTREVPSSCVFMGTP